MPNDIKGISSKEYPKVFRSIDNVLSAFNINNILFEVGGKTPRPNPINLQAHIFNKKGLKIKLKKTIITTKIMLDFMEKEFSPEEIESLFGHEFSHLKNDDDLRLAAPFIVLLAIAVPLYWIYAQPDIVRIIIAICLILVACVPALLIACIISRFNELRADRESIFKIRKPDAFKSGYEKIGNEGSKYQKEIDESKLGYKIIKTICILGYPSDELRFRLIDKYKKELEK
jgi:Zn-dependent protease with chaperone function